MNYCKIEQERAGIVSIIAIILMGVLVYISLEQNSEWFSTGLWMTPSMLLIYSIPFGQNCKFIRKIFQNKIIMQMGSISFEFFLIHQLCIRYMNYIYRYFSYFPIAIRCLLDFMVSIVLAYLWKELVRKLPESPH